jgi:flagellar assembly protein FliH
LVQAELALKPERIAEIVDGLLARVRRAERAIVRAHPDDVPALERFLRERELSHVALEADAALARGGCVVATPIGTLDASLETRVDALRRALQKATR